MRTLLIIALFLCAMTTKATNFYFSTNLGDDSRTPAQAQNPATPWKTLNKLNSYMNSFKAGDSVLFKRGESFYGLLNITKSGSVTAPIVIGAYGRGEKPIITSLATLDNWVSKGDGIWESSNPLIISQVNIVLVNGVQQRLGRYPNADAPLGGYLYFESFSGKTSITDNELTSAINWTGAEIAVRQRRWKIDRATITKHSGNTITHTGTTGEPYKGYGYFIQNDIKTLDQFGEWYYNPSTKKLSVYFGSKSPSSFVVQATTGGNLITTEKASNIVFDNLDVEGANGWSFNLNSGTNIYIKNCDVLFAGKGGIASNGHLNLKIEYCTISGINNNAINLGYADNAIVRHNKILNTSVLAGMGNSGEGAGVGIMSNGDGNIIEYNEIRNTGYNGMSLLKGNNLTIKNNIIDSFCMIKDDGGGIYTYGSDDEDRTGIKITGNIIMNGIGAGYGISDMGKTAAEGLYLDGNSSGMEITNNTITNTDKGIYLHSTRNITIKNNTVYNNNIQLMLKQKEAFGPLRNTIVTDNILFSKTSSQLASNLVSHADDINLFGKFESNYYARPLDDRFVIAATYPDKTGANATLNMDLESWRSKFNKDQLSKRTPKQIALYKLNKLVGADRFINGDFATNAKGALTSSCTTLWTTNGKLDGGHILVTPSSKTSTISIKIGSITAGKKYILRYSLRGTTDNGMIMKNFLRQDNSPYSIIGSSQNHKITTQRSDVEMMFSPSRSENAANIIFQINEQTPYYLDNIHFFEAEAIPTNIEDSVSFVINATNMARSVALNGNFIDVRNTNYSNNIVLQPYSSAVLLKTSGGQIQNEAPSVSISSPTTETEFTSSAATININATASDADGSVAKVEFYNGNTLLGTDNSSPYSFNWNNVAPGNYKLTAKATDNDGLTTSSSVVSVSVVKPNDAPSVSINSPSVNAEFISAATINISAVANDADGSVAKVEFYNGNTLLGTDNSSPYSFNWNNVAPGNYKLTAKATDNGGLTTSSSAVTVSVVKPNEAPSVSIKSPAVNTEFTSSTTINIMVAASDADGSIAKVEFYNGNTLLGTDNSSPYSFNWNNVAAGNYTLKVIATDNSGSTSSSAVTISVVKPNEAPSVSITSPTVNAEFTSTAATINISATANDADGSVTKVEFYNGNTLLGTDNSRPYSFNWNNVAPGNYNLTAKAIDNDGLITSSSAVTVSVVKPNEAPSVSITSPTVNAEFTSSATINISATANDADGSVAKVEFYNGNTLLGTDNSRPYSFNWNNVVAGNYNLTAKAIDNDGLITSSSAVTVSVVKPNEAPSVFITSPTVNAEFTSSGTINISATANDADGSITKVEFYNGNIILGTDNSSPYSYNWNNLTPGNYKLTAKATDNQGLITSSSVVTVSVVKPNEAPSVSITGPSGNAEFTSTAATINISATANDADGSVAKVEFYNGNTLLGTDNSRPYSFNWNDVAPGNYNLTAKAIDNDGLTTSSSAVTISVVKPNEAPSVSITGPSGNAEFTSTAATINISATANDADGTVTKVEFYNGNTLLGTDNSRPYSFNWNNVAPGNYNLIAKAIDNDGLTTSSSAVTISVVKPNEAPSVSITGPSGNAEFTSTAATINISATANDADGTVTKVEFYNGNTLLGTDNSRPYSFNWNNVAPGNYNLTAKAIDNDGLTTSSSTVTISVVKPNEAPSVSITSPTVNAEFTSTAATININASATDADGSVTKVEFYNGNTFLGTDNSSPYSFSWNNVAPGNYTLIAKATDNSNLATSSSVVNVSVVKPNEAPSVSITSPTVNAEFTSTAATININASATDADGSVTKVEFYNDNILLGTDNSSPYSFNWNNVAPGNYKLTAKAIDNGGLITSSSAVSVSVVKPNDAPSVSIVSPAVNTEFTSAATINISATATDIDGSVTKVEFYNGNTLLGTDNSRPYSFNWNNVAPGNYNLIAKAIDNDGLATSSSAVTVSVVNSNEAPSISITSPSVNTEFTPAATINISATATDADGSVAKVEFYNGNTLLGTDNSSPYSFNWNNVAAGNYTLKVIATDNSGSTSSDAVAVSVVKPNEAPSVSITDPSVNAEFTSTAATININATANDADGSITKVEFYNGNTLLGTDNSSPYSFNWNNVTPGNYSLIVKATDNANLSTSSSAVNISVVKPNDAPSVSIVNPAINTDFDAPATIDITATATDADGSIAKVEFYNGSTLLGSDNTSPYTFTWNDAEPGNYTLTAKATDNSGLIASSNEVNVSVIRQNQAPTVTLSNNNPSSNAGFSAATLVSSSTLNMSALASDADGSISKVEFYNGNALLAVKRTSPYTLIWENMPAGNYTITAIATDNEGLKSSPSSISITVAKNTAPTVTITNPKINSSFKVQSSIDITAVADDADGRVTKVEFYNGNTLLGSDKSSPYSFNWNKVPAGSYVLTAKATDNSGNTTSSSAITFTVDNSNVSKAPTVKITDPLDNATFFGKTNVDIEAIAKDNDGKIAKVEFFNGRKLIKTEFSAPYAFTWKNVTIGNYILTAKATDNKGNVTVSSAIAFNILNPTVNKAPTVKITKPVSSTKFYAPADINITAVAGDADGTIAKVEFFKGNTLVKTEYKAPFTCSLENLPAGSYTLTAKATDERGLTTTSLSVPVTVEKSKISGGLNLVTDSHSANDLALARDGYNSHQDPSKAVNVKIGPNPTSNTLSVYTNGLDRNQGVEISVMSMSGITLKTVNSNTANQVIQVNVASLKAGIYLLRIAGKDSVIYKQFEKQ